MASDTLLISAYFSHLQQSEFGGRSQHLAECKYLYSLKSMKKMQTPMVVWLDARYKDEYINKITPLTYEQTKFECMNLLDSPYYQIIKELKSSKGIELFGKERSYDFCINKMLMIKRTLEMYPGYKYYWWIDAGLSYENNFPYKYFKYINDVGHQERFNECSLFDQPLIKGFNKQLQKNKVTAVMMTRAEHYIDPEEMPEIAGKSKTIIGGLFGGTKRMMVKMINELLPLMDAELAKGHLYLEEVYLTLLSARRPELFNLQTFDTWYSSDQKHALDEHGNPPPGDKFYEIFEKAFEAGESL
jgi:hypothetical protein